MIKHWIAEFRSDNGDLVSEVNLGETNTLRNATVMASIVCPDNADYLMLRTEEVTVSEVPYKEPNDSE